jgi:hypothetical protein
MDCNDVHVIGTWTIKTVEDSKSSKCFKVVDPPGEYFCEANLIGNFTTSQVMKMFTNE